MGYDYHIEYKKGYANKVANKPNANWWARLQRECTIDPFYTNLAIVSNVIQREGV